jgi:ribonuclease-3
MNDDITQMKSWFKNGDFTLHKLNEKNIYITAEFIENILKKYGLIHKVKNLQLFQTAMTHVSYLNNATINIKTAKLLKEIQPIEDRYLPNVMPLSLYNYNLLELIGDGCAHYAIVQYLFERYPDENEGFITRLRASIEQTKSFATISRKLGFHKYVVIARNVEINNGRTGNDHLLEDVFEAFIGALSLEVSYEKCKKFIINIIEKEIDIAELLYADDNYKDRLMQYYHKQKWTEPKYIDISPHNTMGTQEQRKFIINVKNNTGQIIGQGFSTVSKNKAEQLAAQKALITLQVIKENEEEADDYYGELSDDEEDYFEEKE